MTQKTNYELSLEQMAEGIILCCPQCLKSLLADDEKKVLFCEDHGVLPYFTKETK